MNIPTLPSIDLPSIRETEFQATSALTYFDHASDSPIPERSAKVIAERNHLLQDPSAPVKLREEYLDDARRRLGRMLNAPPSQFAFLTNIPDTTATIANGIDWQPGDEVVLIRGEFASLSDGEAMASA